MPSLTPGIRVSVSREGVGGWGKADDDEELKAGRKCRKSKLRF
jgi:hypothetical protein